MMQSLPTAATAAELTSYVIKSYQASLKHNVFVMQMKGTKITFNFCYPYSIILPCLKLSLIAELNIRLVIWKKLEGWGISTKCHCHFASQVHIWWVSQTKLCKSGFPQLLENLEKWQQFSSPRKVMEFDSFIKNPGKMGVNLEKWNVWKKIVFKLIVATFISAV